jgi:hypothetical protein
MTKNYSICPASWQKHIFSQKKIFRAIASTNESRIENLSKINEKNLMRRYFSYGFSYKMSIRA